MFNIDAGLVNQNDDPTLRWQLTSRVLTIFASTISVRAGYRQCQTNSRALKVISIQIFNEILKYSYFKSRPIFRQISNLSVLLFDRLLPLFIILDMKFKTCFADKLMFIAAKLKKNRP